MSSILNLISFGFSDSLFMLESGWVDARKALDQE
jgi:hypothetical protein